MGVWLSMQNVFDSRQGMTHPYRPVSKLLAHIEGLAGFAVLILVQLSFRMKCPLCSTNKRFLLNTIPQHCPAGHSGVQTSNSRGQDTTQRQLGIQRPQGTQGQRQS